MYSVNKSVNLADLFENRAALLDLQQRLIQDLPEEYEVNLLNHKTLGPSVVVKYTTPSRSRSYARLLKPEDDPSRVFVGTHGNRLDATLWSSFAYRGIINLFNGWSSSP